MANPLLILFPGALGDFLCLWPALEMLRHRRAEHITVAIKSDLHVLLPPGGFLPVSIERREVADLFAAAAPLRPETLQLFGGYRRIHSWTGHGDANFAARLRRATGGIVTVHRFRGMRDGEHAARYYGRCLGLAPPPADLDPGPAARQWAARFRRRRGLGPRTLIVHPGSGGRHKNWEGTAAVAAWWRERRGGNVLVLAGPAERDSTIDLPAACLRCAPLDRVAALLQQAYLYLGNDSGISHLAGAVGARGVVLFGPTNPASWRPYGSTLRVLSAPGACVSCAPDRFCTHRLPVRAVRDALTAIAERERAAR